MVWYLTLNPNIIVIQPLYVYDDEMCACVLQLLLFVQKKTRKKKSCSLFSSIHFYHCHHCLVRWVDLSEFVCVPHLWVFYSLFVDYTMNSGECMHWQKSNNEYNARRWKCTPLNSILTVFPHCLHVAPITF